MLAKYFMIIFFTFLISGEWLMRDGGIIRWELPVEELPDEAMLNNPQLVENWLWNQLKEQIPENIKQEDIEVMKHIFIRPKKEN